MSQRGEFCAFCTTNLKQFHSEVEEACSCNNVIRCRDFHISLCWDGCTGHRQVEDDRIQLRSSDLVQGRANRLIEGLAVVVKVYGFQREGEEEREEKVAVSSQSAYSASLTSFLVYCMRLFIWWAGLMRGPVSIALAFNQFTMDGSKNKSIQDASLITTTITVVLVSTIVFGTPTPPLIAWLYPPHHRSKHSDASGSLSPKATLDTDIRIPLLLDTSRDGEQDGEDGTNARIPMNQYLGDLTRLQSLSALLTASRSTIQKHVLVQSFGRGF